MTSLEQAIAADTRQHIVRRALCALGPWPDEQIGKALGCTADRVHRYRMHPDDMPWGQQLIISLILGGVGKLLADPLMFTLELLLERHASAIRTAQLQREGPPSIDEIDARVAADLKNEYAQAVSRSGLAYPEWVALMRSFGVE